MLVNALVAYASALEELRVGGFVSRDVFID